MRGPGGLRMSIAVEQPDDENQRLAGGAPVDALGTIDSVDEITTAEQAFAVVIATALSLGTGIITQFFIPGVDPHWLPLLWQVLGIVGVVYVGFGWDATRRFLARHLTIFERQTPPLLLTRLQTAALFIASVQCVIILGYFTTFTGGTFHSPYSQSLIAMALLSPQIAKTKNTVVMMGLIVFAAFAAFGDWTGTSPTADLSIPAWLYFVMPFIAAIIALLNPLGGKPRQAPLVWKGFSWSSWGRH